MALAHPFGPHGLQKMQSRDQEALATNHEAILRTYVQRQYDKVVTPARVFASPELMGDDPQDQNRN